jgi:hypothetical protein
MKRFLAITLSLGLHGYAEAGEYRQLTLSDGRVIQADVLETMPFGLRINTPQGDSTVAFELLTNMEPITGAAFAEQENWVVYIYAPDVKHELLTKIYSRIDQVDVYGSPETQGYLTPDQEMTMQGCGADLSCISKLSSDLGAPWMWVVSIDRPEGGEWEVTSGVSLGSQRHKTVVSGSTPPEWFRAAHEAIGLVPPKMSRADESAIFGEAKPEKQSRPAKTVSNTSKQKPEKPEKEPKSPQDLSAADLERLGYVPLPGMPALAQQDMAGFGLAMGAAVPLTAVWAGAVGKHAQSGAEFATLTALGFYALTVSINKLTSGPKKSKPAIPKEAQANLE